MTEDDKLIFGGIISVVVCIIFTIISTILIEKKLPTKKAKLLSYLCIFLLGIILLLIWPFPGRDEKFIIATPTIIGASLATFTFVAFLVSSFINSEIKMAQTMTANAVLIGKALNLTTHGIPEDKKTPFHKLYFYYTGLINNTWTVSHSEEREYIRSTATIAEQKKNPNASRFRTFLVYKMKLNHNTATEIAIVSKKNEKETDYMYAQQGYEKLNSQFSDLNDHINIYCKSGKENIISKLQNPIFRKLLVDNSHELNNGFRLNQEKGLSVIKINISYPNLGVFDMFATKKVFNYQLEQRKSQLKFFTEFLNVFDK
ncbi:MAG: hypothetical protein SFY56_08890 [Bacteroidota bacterium]|nr:hypothetical protein [Bacteroidota bacterium]